MQTILRIFALAAGVLLSTPEVSAQQAVNRAGYWLIYSGDNRLNDKIGIHSDVNFRNIFIANTYITGVARIGINYYWSQALISGGYAYILNESSNQETNLPGIRENRLWQQVMFRKRDQVIFTEHRYRLEQRWVERENLPDTQFSQRIRYRFQAIYPFYHIDTRFRHFFFASYNEIMLNFKRESADVFDRNRIYFALGIQVSPKLNFQFGFMNQLANQRNFPNHQVINSAMASVAYNMDGISKILPK